jgi:MFS superfamily sulfate permease-like transporter
MSLLFLIRRIAHPHIAFLGNIPGTRGYADVERHPDNIQVPGVLVFRVEASLLYFNVDHVRNLVWKRIRSSAEPPKLVVCDLSASDVDLAGAHMLASLHKELLLAGIQLRLVGAHAAARDMLRSEGLKDFVGDFDPTTSVADVIDDFQGRSLPARA